MDYFELDDLVVCEAAKKKELDEREQRNNSWISELTWKLIDQKALARRRRDSETLRVLKKSVQRSLRTDRRARAAAAAKAAQAHSFGAIKGWYKDVGPPRPHKPSEADINFTRSCGERQRMAARRPTDPHMINDGR